MLAEISQQNVNVLIAFGGGIVSFLSPCVLPIVPAYLSLITGLSVGELTETGPRPAISCAGSRSTPACSSPGSRWCSCSSA